MYLIYVDDSHDEKIGVFSALAVPEAQWQTVFQRIKQFRRDLKASDGIRVYEEFHAWKFVSGRGDISDEVVTKSRRCGIFREMLELLAAMPDVLLFNAVFPAKQDERAFERLLNRINRTMQAHKDYALVISDEGKEAQYTRLARKMHVYNPIPSQYGGWTDTGTARKNIPIERVIEDPFFKDSQKSYLIQAVDFCAYALLRREHQLQSKNRYGLHEAFAVLAPILFREANRRDPEGIIRL